MRIWAIGDLHLPGGDKKPMDIFGPHWKDHFERICRDWREKVSIEDVVLIPGDISWAMHLSEALEDLRRIAELPGDILLLRGNHDYWWSSLTQLRQALPERMFAIQNDAFMKSGIVFCGTRGWTLPIGSQADEKNLKIYSREVLRLELSLREARRIAPDSPMMVMMHYPPVTMESLDAGTEFTRLLTEYGASRCVYGHLHGPSIPHAFNGVYQGVQYDLVSCDALGFKLREITISE